jgi:hypothetical protein
MSRLNRMLGSAEPGDSIKTRRSAVHWISRSPCLNGSLVEGLGNLSGPHRRRRDALNLLGLIAELEGVSQQ